MGMLADEEDLLTRVLVWEAENPEEADRMWNGPWWPPLPGERDEDGELVESLPETAELREWWPGDRREDAS